MQILFMWSGEAILHNWFGDYGVCVFCAAASVVALFNFSEIIMREKACCFTGHRKIPAEHYQIVCNKTEEAVEKLINDGYIHFCAGGALGFDTVAALSVLKAKEKHPDICLVLVLPCKSQTRGWSDSDVEIYENIKQQADEVIYTSEEYTRGCMHKRNRVFVQKSSACVAYLTESKGGTAYTAAYAVNHGLAVFNIADSI